MEMAEKKYARIRELTKDDKCIENWILESAPAIALALSTLEDVDLLPGGRDVSDNNGTRLYGFLGGMQYLKMQMREYFNKDGSYEFEMKAEGEPSLRVIPRQPLKESFQENDEGPDYTTDERDSRLHHGYDEEPTKQHDLYLVLSQEERQKGFVRPYRDAYVHNACGALTTMKRPLAETYARDPKFYGSTYCIGCKMHRPVAEFVWDKDRKPVGS